MSEEKNIETTTNVEQIDVNLDEIFNGAPGADSITLPEEKKPNMFSRPEKVDLTFLDEEPVVEEPPIEEPTVTV